MSTESAWAQTLEASGQKHLVRHAGRLPGDERAAFLESAAAQPWNEIRAALQTPETGAPPVLRPPHALTLRRQRSGGGIRKELGRLGDGLLAGGRVATLLLAGGQGSRLGFDGPKGNFVLGPEPDRTLYAIHAERVAAASRTSGHAVPFYVLVSEGTEEATRRAFEEGARAWGLEEGQVRIVRQRRLPALDDAGCALVGADGKLAMAPDGHGGALGALHRSGAIEALAADGVDVLTTFQVDNPLALGLDPVMLGWMVERRAQAMGKAVARLPDEKVGVFARDAEGRHLVVEYSEFPDGGMPDDLTMGSIATHGFSIPWLRDLFADGLVMPYHRAHKKVAHLAEDGSLVEPDAPNAWKLEQFIFDVIPLADRAAVHEVEREHEFAPVKNAEGSDSPTTARALVEASVRRWYAEQGKDPPEPVSLHPLEMT